jgi:hypothetical protein
MAKASGGRGANPTNRSGMGGKSNRPSGKGTKIGTRTKAQAAVASGNAAVAGLKGRAAESARYSTGAGGGGG